MPQCPSWCATLVHVHQEDMFKFSEVEGKAVLISPQSETLWTPSKGERILDPRVENHTEAPKS